MRNCAQTAGPLVLQPRNSGGATLVRAGGGNWLCAASASAPSRATSGRFRPACALGMNPAGAKAQHGGAATKPTARLNRGDAIDAARHRRNRPHSLDGTPLKDLGKPKMKI